MGNPGENARMAEFFAQRGYIFISASFHLPHKDIPFGWESFLNDLILEREVMKFAKQMSGDRNVFFIGHSWGAQLGWCLLHEEGLADGFVSMETTLEFKTDSAEVSDKWPHMLKLHYDSDVKYKIPVLALASARKVEPMAFFRSLDCYDLTEVIFPYSFDHEAFTSQYLMRGEIGHDIPVPDRSAIAESQIVYDQMLELILQFFKSVQHDEQKDSQTQSSQKRAVRMMNLKGDVISK
jgi:pimeloyl-ACP methyl ester carboxylesterase